MTAYAGTLEDMVLYPDQIQGGAYETLVENTDVFNAASRNALRIVPALRKAEYAAEAFTQRISTTLIRRRDPSSVSAIEPDKIAQEEALSIKVNRGYLIEQTEDAFRKALGAGVSAEALSYMVGQQIAKEMLGDMSNVLIGSVTGALSLQATNLVDLTEAAAPIVTTASLVDALAKMGDSAHLIRAWVMSPTVFYNLTKRQISESISGIANIAVMSGGPTTLGIPVIVTDCPALVIDGGSDPDTYVTLGLTENAGVIEDSETRSILTERVGGLANIVQRVQGEYAYNVGVKGFSWNTTTGGTNPTDAYLAAGTYWTKVRASHKDLAGVAILSTEVEPTAVSLSDSISAGLEDYGVVTGTDLTTATAALVTAIEATIPETTEPPAGG